MRLGCEILVCGFALCYSVAAVQPRALSHHQVQVLNTTTSSSSAFTTNSTLLTISNSTSSICAPQTTLYDSSTCVNYCIGATLTFFAFAENATSTQTNTLTLYGNSTSFPFPLTSPASAPPNSTTIPTLPPQPCPIETPYCIGCEPLQPSTTTSLITSKTAVVTSLVTAPPPGVCFSCVDANKKIPGNAVISAPITTPPAQVTSPDPGQGPDPEQLQDSSPNVGMVGMPGDPTGSPASLTTVTVNGIPIGLPGPGSGNSIVMIDGTPIIAPTDNSGGGGAVTVTAAGGEVFTVNPSQVVGEGTTIARPVGTGVTPLVAAAAAGSDPTPAPMTTVVDGVTLAIIGSSVAVVDGTSFTIAPGETPTTVVVGGVSVSIGAGGVGLPGTTVRPALGGGDAGTVAVDGAGRLRYSCCGEILVCMLLSLWFLV